MSMPAETPSIVQSSDRRRELIRPTLARRVKWRVEAIGYAIFETALGGLPLSWVARIGRGLGAFAHVFLTKRRRTVMRNVRIAFAGEKSQDELRALTSEVFRRSGANLLSSLRTVRLTDSQLTKGVNLRDEAIFHEAAARGRGVIMVLAHMGNWEALAQWLPKLLPPGLAGATIYRPLNNPILNRRVAATRRRRGVELFSKDDNPLGMAGFLRRGGVLGVLSDQRAGNIGELVPFFGRLTSCTPIPAILARRTGAVIVGVSLRTVATGCWEVQFHALNEASPRTVNVMELVERMVRVSPADVFWMQERWRISSSAPHRQNGKMARGEIVPASKRRRALLWAADDGVLPVAPLAIPDDVSYEVVVSGDFHVPGGLRIHSYGGGSVHEFLQQVDLADDQPLDYVVGGGSRAKDVARACDQLGLGWLEAGA